MGSPIPVLIAVVWNPLWTVTDECLVILPQVVNHVPSNGLVDVCQVTSTSTMRGIARHQHLDK